MITRLSLLGLAALAACNPPGDNAPPATTPSATPEASDVLQLSPVSSLAGEYRVAGIDGAPIDAPIGLALSVSENRIVFDGFCGKHLWDYRLEGTRLATTRRASPDPGCLARASFPRAVFDLVAAVDAATQAGRDPTNAIVLSGGGQSVTLYSQ